MTKNVAQNKTTDHRTRVGKERRERMRGRILQSVMAVCNGASEGRAVVIDDVIRHADIARGTFYKYFDSLEEAVAILGSQMAIEMTEGIYCVYDILEAPLMRTATGFQTFLLRSLMEPQWGAFITHISLLSNDNLLVHHIKTDIKLGVDTGDYCVISVDVAADLLIGAMIEAMRHLISGRGDAAYVQAMTQTVLQAFGVSRSKAEKVVAKSFAHLCCECPDKIHWWRALDD